MLRITVELVPRGQETRKRTLGVMEVANVGGTSTRGEYDYLMTEEENLDLGISARSRRGVVRDYLRHQSVWRLVQAVLGEALPSKD